MGENWLKEFQETIKYFWMVFVSVWKTKEWNNIVKVFLVLLFTFLILDCLILFALFSGLPEFITQLIDDFSTDARVGLTRLAFTFLIFGLIFPYLFLREASKIHNKQEIEKEQLRTKAKKLQRNQDSKDALRYYDDLAITYHVLAETVEEKRAEYKLHRPTQTRRLPYLIKNEGSVSIKECRIKMTSLTLRDSVHNYGKDISNMPLEDKPIKWKNSDRERVDLGIDSAEPIVFAKITDDNAITAFNFVTFGDEKRNINEKVLRFFQGTWDVGVQVEGQITKNGIPIDLVPIPYTISFRFENFNLTPLDIIKHERSKPKRRTSSKKIS
jgi:hypothetical protein